MSISTKISDWYTGIEKDHVWLEIARTQGEPPISQQQLLFLV